MLKNVKRTMQALRRKNADNPNAIEALAAVERHLWAIYDEHAVGDVTTQEAIKALLIAWLTETDFLTVK